MADFLQHIIPLPHPDVEEIFQVHQITYEFYREVEDREAFEQYCDWYDDVADQHQQEVLQMAGDVNVLGWFYRAKGIEH